MFRITISGDNAVFQTLYGISKPQSVKQRVYCWDDCIGTYSPTLPWDQQWCVERRIPCGSGVIRSTGGDKTWCIESIEIPSIRAPPPIVDDVYDEHVTMYTLDSHITMLEMKDMSVFIGVIEKLRGLPFDSYIISLLNKIVTESGSCLLGLSQQGSLQPQLQQSLQLAERSHDRRPHQSQLQLQEDKSHQPEREQRDARLHRSHDRPGHAQQRPPYRASRFHESGAYVPKMPNGAQNVTGRPPLYPSHRHPIDRGQSHPLHRTTPSTGMKRGVRRPEFVPE